MSRRIGAVARRQPRPAAADFSMMMPGSFGSDMMGASMMPGSAAGGYPPMPGAGPTAGMQPMMQSTPMYGQKQMPPGYPQAPGAARNAHQQQQLQQQQQRHASFPAAGGAGGGAQLPASAMQKLLDMERTVKKWEGILKELTEAVFVVCATVMTDNLPYYSELPTSEADLRLPTGTLANNTKVTLIYPQYPPPNLGLLFMRVRFCDPSTSAINQCFVPVANMKLQPQQVYALTGINSSESQYLNYFHNPGEADPNPNSSQNLLMHRLAALEAAAGLSSAAGDEQLYTE